MGSLCRSRLTDFCTQRACEGVSHPIYSSIAGHSHRSFHRASSPTHPFHPAAPPHEDQALSSAAMALYHRAHTQGMQSSIRPSNGISQESSFFSAAHASGSITNMSPDDQAISAYYPQTKQSAVSRKAPLNAVNSKQESETYLNASKKRSRAVMACKDSINTDTDAKKRTKTDAREPSHQQNGDCMVTEVKPVVINAEKAKSKSSSRPKQKSVSEQLLSQSKANLTETSSLTQDQLSPTKQDYIHVRARRGQATDSHSLAERVRREKIGERMKYLQELVPSCVKVTGKAMMLDEIINYVQSLQQQVEFLSMKLAAVPLSRLEFKFDDLFGKKAVEPNIVTSISGKDSATVTSAVCLIPPTDYSSNTGQSGSFHDSSRSNEILPDRVCLHDVRSSMRLPTPLKQETCKTSSGSDEFFAIAPCEFGADDSLMQRTTADSGCCNYAACSLDAMLDQPVHQFSISQGSGQVELEWDEDMQNIVQQIGSLNSQANSSWFPSDNLITEGFFLQGIAKEEL